MLSDPSAAARLEGVVDKMLALHAEQEHEQPG
jgi:hypothetical protein